MFFFLSKVLFVVARPSNALVLAMLAGLALGFRRRSRTGPLLVVGAVLATAILGWSGVGKLFLEPLETRFPASPQLPGPPTGIIVLGGPLDAAGHRLVAAVELWRRHPEAKVIFTGGSGSFVDQGPAEAEVAGPKLIAMGIPPDKLVLEGRSRNTPENAAFTYDLVRPKPGERWVLVTSAFHMPRSIGVFRVAGWSGLTAWPVDFRSGNAGFLYEQSSIAGGLSIVDLSIREWIGLVAYRALGYTDALLPAP